MIKAEAAGPIHVNEVFYGPVNSSIRPPDTPGRCRRRRDHPADARRFELWRRDQWTGTGPGTLSEDATGRRGLPRAMGCAKGVYEAQIVDDGEPESYGAKFSAVRGLSKNLFDRNITRGICDVPVEQILRRPAVNGEQCANILLSGAEYLPLSFMVGGTALRGSILAGIPRCSKAPRKIASRDF